MIIVTACKAGTWLLTWWQAKPVPRYTLIDQAKPYNYQDGQGTSTHVHCQANTVERVELHHSNNTAVSSAVRAALPAAVPLPLSAHLHVAGQHPVSSRQLAVLAVVAAWVPS